METGNVLLRIRSVQRTPGDKPEVMELQTEGTVTPKDGYVEISYAESELTDLKGVTTTFRLYGSSRVVLIRDGEKLKNRMNFVLGEKSDSLYDVGFGALLITTTTRRVEVDLKKGRFEVEYTVEVEHTFMGVNTYEVTVLPQVDS